MTLQFGTEMPVVECFHSLEAGPVLLNALIY